MEENLEEIALEIDLTPHWWSEDGIDHVPEVSVLFNGEEIYHGTPKEPFTVTWEGQLEEDVEQTIEVKLLNKIDADTVVEDGTVLDNKNVMIEITKIKISSIDLETLLWSHSNYVVDDHNEYVPESTQGITTLGWNGTWSLKFTTPVYIWLLENL